MGGDRVLCDWRSLGRLAAMRRKPGPRELSPRAQALRGCRPCASPAPANARRCCGRGCSRPVRAGGPRGMPRIQPRRLRRRRRRADAEGSATAELPRSSCRRRVADGHPRPNRPSSTRTGHRAGTLQAAGTGAADRDPERAARRQHAPVRDARTGGGRLHDRRRKPPADREHRRTAPGPRRREFKPVDATGCDVGDRRGDAPALCRKAARSRRAGAAVA